ncbi:Glycosyltransferase family 31 protein [Pyrenophora tritici-repentis]|nr:Glycosyltransferase family 31 protein [Pyrenophora tritici-repentis]KAG9382854.1 Glycosyltransferase family 31 protein [Pyrenophora tritici-repentis]KAI0580815.1 Glycosyltransferase family 31 protein [Pyrenophora tritici-repentis]KAI0582506.1 Glycosyltransferase family 31 protein [Pyrenophora tritici-repentis]KAI0609690.1 Glycosyltransferase family 31 protein [Pyrenophora tritici-repentis]
MPHRSVLCRLLFCAIFSVSVLNIFTRASSPFFHQDGRTYAQKHTEELFCPHSDLADDILIVLRTGATESLEKVPVHFRTTLRCVPHFVVHSDLEEEIEGHAVHDVLKDVTEETKKKQDDFKLYHQLQEHGRRGVHQKVETSMSGSSQGDYLRTDNAGWQLDKWKFLPMVDQALKEKPDAKWYVFIETDTYLGWNNLLQYLSQFDDSKPYYIGKHLFIKDVEFAYGGAGFALSNPAIRKVSQQRSTKVSEYEEFTATHWVGDCALGKVLEDAKVPLYRAFPHFQSDSPATLNPAITKIDRVLEWNNMSADKEYNAHDHSAVDNELERNAWKSFDHCHALCEEQTDCIQFSFNEGSCGISTTFKLGYAKPHTRFRSGWMLDRVDDLFKTLEAQCGMRDWWAPQEETQRELKMRRKRSLPAPKI